VFEWLAERLRQPMPPTVDDSAGSRRRAGNKRVVNEKLRAELGWELKYPTFRDGYAAELGRLEKRDA
jgi:hypothetical protein